MRPWIKLIRPKQWTKNFFCLVGIFFIGKFSADLLLPVLMTFVAFCLVSSSVYIFNDLIDREADKIHKVKRERPLAKGDVSVLGSCVLSAVFLLSGLAIVGNINNATLSCVGFYLLVNISYSLWLKHVVLVDTFCIAMGFVLRLLSGIYAINAIPTGWITLCTMFLAIFLAFGKRRCELNANNEASASQRPVLTHYTVEFLDFLLNSTATMTIMSYAIFTTSSGKNPSLVMTVPIVYYAIVYYKRLVMVLNIGEDPTLVILKDRKLQLAIILWLFVYLGIVIYDIQWFAEVDSAGLIKTLH